jgi:hypothetical protein
MPEAALALKQGLAHELANAKLIVFNDTKCAIGADFEASASLISTDVDARGDYGELRCHASGLHPQHMDG